MEDNQINNCNVFIINNTTQQNYFTELLDQLTQVVFWKVIRIFFKRILSQQDWIFDP